ncbi:MAG: hypothetical protein EXR75_00945 [Myxococcales bacterium]|nr:hypothetical protein [Myxococcales bacterium]
MSLRTCSLVGLLVTLPIVGFFGCSSDDTDTTPEPACVADLESGDPNGHADPFGAKAAGQARASRIAKGSDVPQPAHGRQPIKDGDYLLINDKIAVTIEAGRLSDGYGRFGGEIVAIDEVGADGRPMGRSRYIETLVCYGVAQPNPSSVTVLADGSDGGEAIVRVVGTLETIPFLGSTLAALFPNEYGLEVAYDYVLAPGSEKVVLRVSIRNTTPDAIDFGLERPGSDELYGFFQGSHNLLTTEANGFGSIGPTSPWVGFVGGPTEAGREAAAFNFAWRTTDAEIEKGVAQSGFSLFNGPGFIADGCAITTLDRVEIIAGGPEYDGLREAIRRTDSEPPWRALAGKVTDADGKAMANAYVHELATDGSYLSRTRTGKDGAFLLHAPPGNSVRLVASELGYVHKGLDVKATDSDVVLAFEADATLHIVAKDDSGTALPVRIQVIPTTAAATYPEEFGVEQPANGRLYQVFELDGDATISVPPGEHRVIVTRGYEYELHDETVTVAAGDTKEVTATLVHSVDTAKVMCADFHIHSQQSPDSSDPIDFKVAGAIADGLDIPCSSEHEWVVDFGPVVAKLGMTKWAFGMSSLELTTFAYGHFGIIPMKPRPGEYNNGAIDWIGKSPTETFAAVDALDTKPALIVNHPRSSIGGYFTAMALDPMTGEALDADRYSDNYDAIEVFNDSSFEQNRKEDVRDWFHLLMRGKRVFAVGNSDTHALRTTPAGYPRTCFAFGHDDPTKLSPELVRDLLLSGNSTVSGGLYMTVTGPGGEKPGQSVAAGKKKFTVTVESPSWVDASELEVIVDGETTAMVALLPIGNGPSNRYANEVEVNLTGKKFVLFHARSEKDLAPLHPGREAFAVSNPIFVE